MKILITDESGEWRAEYGGLPLQNNGVTTTPHYSISLSVVNVDPAWRDMLNAIMEYQNLNV